MSTRPPPPAHEPSDASDSNTSDLAGTSTLNTVHQGPGEVVGRHRVFDVRRHQVTQSEPSPLSFEIFTLAMPDWVTVVALSRDQRVVLVRQHRYGTDEVMLETPGGVIDSGESPRQAAERELREETGYQGGRWQSLGWAHPNPALQDNRIHFWLVQDAEPTAETAFDEHEQVETVLLQPPEVRRALQRGVISHALSALALERAFQAL